MAGSRYQAHRSDTLLWDQVRTSDETALSDLSYRWYRPLFHYGTKLTTDHALIQDGIQDLFLTIWEKRQTLPTVKSVQAYLFVSLRHNLIRHVKHDRAYTSLIDTDCPADLLTNPESLYTEAEDHALVSNRLQRALGQLPKRQREAVYLRYYENLSYDEIALIMGLNRQVVANYLQHALQNLRQHWPVLFWLLAILR